MTPERKALDRIAAVLDHEGAAIEPPTYVTLRAILAEVTPEPGDFNPHYDPRYELGYRDGVRVQPGGDMQSPLALPGDMQSFGPETYRSGGVLDRDQARRVLERCHIVGPYSPDEIVDTLAGCVRPAAIDRDALLAILMEQWTAEPRETADRVLALVRPVAIDRDALRHELAVMFITTRPDIFDDEVAADRILALVRPVAGVALSPEETALVLDWYRGTEAVTTTADAALAARLEATQ